MAITETQLTAWRLHRRRGEALPYYCAIAAASLVTPNSSLNIANILPAGTLINLNGRLYVTRNAIESGQWGEIDPPTWRPTYIVPKKTTDTFVDRAKVYWDATNCYATSTASGNKFIGWALPNKDLGTGTNGTGSTLTQAANGACSVASGTSMDGLVGNYANGDTYMEVEMAFPIENTAGSMTADDITASDSSLAVSGLAAAQGGAIVVQGGTSSTAGNAGGAVSLVGGTPGATGVGGGLNITTGAGGATSGASGALAIATGAVTAGAGSASGAITVGSAAGATNAAGTAGASGAVTISTGAGGAGTGQNGGAGGTLSITGGAGGATTTATGGAGAGVAITAGNGGTASGAGTSGAGGTIVLTAGTSSAGGGTAGKPGHIAFEGLVAQSQGAPTAKTTDATLTIAELQTKLLTGTHAVGATQTYTLPTGTNMSGGNQLAVGDSFDWVLINLSAAAADTVTVAANTDHTVVGNMIVQSAHASTGGVYGNSAQFRSRKTAATTWITYRIA